MSTLTRPGLATLAVLPVLALLSCSAPIEGPDGNGPLRVSERNPRYFTDNSGRAVYLTGSHTWPSLPEIWQGVVVPFDFTAYLDLLEKYNHNFIRLWTWEHATWTMWGPDTARVRFGPPLVYPRTGPGLALDSLPRFDVSRFNDAYFERLRERVQAAAERGIYVKVMLFQGWSIEQKGHYRSPGYGNPWDGHPFNRMNNVNGVDGDPDGDGHGGEIHTLAVPRVTELQKAYIRKVVDTLNDLDNVIYEISNESDTSSVAWQYAMIDYIHEYERSKPKQHPVVMTVPWPEGDNRALFEGPAEAVAPNNDGRKGLYRDVFSPADGSKVVFADTDHLWGIGGNEKWVWKSFTSGYNPIFMDPLEILPTLATAGNIPTEPEWERIRLNMGYTLRFAERMNLVSMLPSPELASSGFCLASPSERLVYLPEGGPVSVDLSDMAGELTLEWFDPRAGAVSDIWRAEGGKHLDLAAPFEGHAVLYVHR